MYLTTGSLWCTFGGWCHSTAEEATAYNAGIPYWNADSSLKFFFLSSSLLRHLKQQWLLHPCRPWWRPRWSAGFLISAMTQAWLVEIICWRWKKTSSLTLSLQENKKKKKRNRDRDLQLIYSPNTAQARPRPVHVLTTFICKRRPSIQ